MINLISLFFLVLICRIGNSDAFSFRFFRPQSSTQTGHKADVTSSLKATATDKSNVVAVTDSNYRELFGGDKVLLLDAFAPWCGPCKLIEPVLEQCAEDWKDSVVVGKFDVEDSNGSRNLKVELILQGAMPQALPALILVHKNKILDTWKGVISPTELQEMLEKHVVQNKYNVVGRKLDFASSSSISTKEGTMVCENGVCKMRPKATNDLVESGKSSTFRGIGLVNNF